MLFVEVDFQTFKTWKSVFDLYHMLIFKGLRVRDIYPKIAPKSQNIHEKQCLEMLCFLYSFFSRVSRFGLHFGSIFELRRQIWSRPNRFFSGNGYKGVSKVPFALILAPKVFSRRPLGSILAPSGLLLVMFGKVWGRFLEGFVGLSPAHKSMLYAVHCTLNAARCTLYAVQRYEL